jgi:hypothetical protein
MRQHVVMDAAHDPDRQADQQHDDDCRKHQSNQIPALFGSGVQVQAMTMMSHAVALRGSEGYIVIANGTMVSTTDMIKPLV